ncbi:hypothetical protein DHEL01_v211010 [Diaporthe helianthi]|uniref:Developmental regulatory protein wetA n=1 Tax=Diaporthe helianthi TaxID=158607 RepID=A0A2P5HK36_DIAHE|nr:hypothetical protein DHEL01_v211010 [Diaporthe helianthi]
MTLAPEPDTAFARAMDYSIDKDEFWQVSCATNQGAAGAFAEDPRSPSDFFDQYVVMEGAGSGGLGAGFFMPLQGGGQAEDEFSPPTSSVTGAITSAPSTNGSAPDVPHATSSFSVEDTLKAISLAESAHHQPLHGRLPERPIGSHSEAAHHVVLGQLNPDALEQRRRLLSGRRGQNQAAGGSITDSELLQIEGLSVNSPHGVVAQQTTSGPTIPTTPPPQDCAPTTTAQNIAGTTENVNLDQLAQRTRNHKSKRFETIYSTLRRAVGGQSRGRVPQQQQHHPNTAPIPQTMTPSHVESAKKATRRLHSQSQAASVSWDCLPISPPLTDLNNLQAGDAAAFGNGYLDDPFFDPATSFNHSMGLAPAAQIGGKGNFQSFNIPSAPSHTPDMKTEHAMDDDLAKYFNASDTWNLESSFGTTTGIDTTSFLSPDGMNVDTWGFDPSSDSGSTLDWAAPTDGAHNSTRNLHNLTIQVPQYVQDSRQHHHTPLSDDLASSGLMIHMPQPRTPGTAPLLSSTVGPMHPPNNVPHYPFPEQSTPQHNNNNNMLAFRGAYTDHGHYGGTQQRRPKPRAPSSGARHHYMGGGGGGAPGSSSISPRKIRQPSSSSSSPSPTPGGRQARATAAGVGGRRAGSLHHRASASDIMTVPATDAQTHAVRKRRSTSSWSRQKRTASTSSLLGDGSSGGPLGGGVGGLGGGGGVGFVNYTPNDHGVLMTGVAPSGSSKTKARREKEALERQRKISEAMVKTMAEAGVDLDRLKQEGIVI